MTASSGRPGPRGQGMVLRTGYFVLDWTLRFTRTTIVIDGRVQELPWGEHFIPLTPGPHDLQVSYRYLRRPAAGKASLHIDAAENEIIHVTYRAPRSVLIAFLPGKLTSAPPTR